MEEYANGPKSYTVHVPDSTRTPLNDITVDDGQMPMLTGGRCEILLYGKGWKIESEINCKADIQGYVEGIIIDSLPVETINTAVELDKEVVILKTNKLIMVESNSILEHIHETM